MSKINALGVWSGDKLFWQFDNGTEIIHKVSDDRLREWLNLSGLFEQEDLPEGGSIRKKHIDVYVINVIDTEKCTVCNGNYNNIIPCPKCGMIKDVIHE